MNGDFILQFLQYLYKFNINHKCISMLLYKFMKQNLTFADKKKIIADIIVQVGLDEVRIEKKTQIMQCLQLILPTDDATGLALFKDRLADWIIANYFDLKTNTALFLQYANLKFLSREARDMLALLFKTCQEKIGEYMDYTDVYHSMLLRNPYYGYQPISYMPPPYMMPPSYPTSRQSYENYEKMYSMDYYMQMSKYYPMYMSSMAPMAPMQQVAPMEMPKFPNPPESVMKNPYYPYPMMPQAPPPMNYMPNPNPTPPKPKPTSPVLPPPAKQKTTPPPPPKPPVKQPSVEPEIEQNSSAIKKTKQKQSKEIQKNAPFFIITPNMQKPQRQEIPQRICPITQQINNMALNTPPGQTLLPVPAPAPQTEMIHQSSEIQIVEQQPVPEVNKPATKNKKANSQTSNKIEQEKPKKQQKNENALNKHHIQMGMGFQQELRNCACKGYGIKKQIYICSECGLSFHYVCTEKRICSDVQICPFCFMKNLDPLNKVEVEIKTFYVSQIRRNKIHERVDFEVYDNYISKNLPYQIQIRSMRLEDASNQNPEYTWPDQCLVMLNDERTIQFQALQHNSSLKKRKDMSVFLTNYIYYYNKNSTQRKSLPIGLEIKQNTFLEMSQKKIRNNYTFLFGLYLVKKKTPEELCAQILEDPTNKVNFVEKFFSEPIEEQIQIEQIKVTLMDPFTWNLIDIPVRGRKCIHGQCFDLKTFLSFMNVQKVRQWKCPVCNKECRSFYVDIQQMQVIKEFRKRQSEGSHHKLSKQIQFHRDGKTLFVVQNDQDEDDEKHNQNSGEVSKTKMISKSSQKSQKEGRQ